MMMNKLIARIYSFLDQFYNSGKHNTKSGKLILFVFNPIFYIFEVIVYRHYWDNIIKNELFTNDNVISFLDRNDFEYDGKKIFKIDLLSEKQYFDSLPTDEAKITIKQEYTDALMEIFKTELVFDVENYINLMVDIDYKGIHKNEEYLKSKVYSVTIRFCRDYYINKTRRIFRYWLPIVTALIYFLIRYIIL